MGWVLFSSGLCIGGRFRYSVNLRIVELDHKRDFKTLAGFVLLCLSVGMGMGTAKTHIYEAIEDYKKFKSGVLRRLEAIEQSDDIKKVQMQRINERLNNALSER